MIAVKKAGQMRTLSDEEIGHVSGGWQVDAPRIPSLDSLVSQGMLGLGSGSVFAFPGDPAAIADYFTKIAANAHPAPSNNPQPKAENPPSSSVDWGKVLMDALQQSFKDSIKGGTIGGVTGAVAGAEAGGIGAIPGAVAGGAFGAAGGGLEGLISGALDSYQSQNHGTLFYY